MKLPSRKTNNKRISKAPPTLIQWRFGVIVFFVFLALAILIARAAYIQVIEPDNLIKQGDMRSIRVKTMPSARGIISDRNDEQLAVSVPVDAVWADPVAIYKAGGLVEVDRWHALADVLGLKRTELLSKIEKNKKRRFIYLQRQISPAVAAYIRKLKLAGIGLKAESRRYYPSGEISAHVIGVTGIDSHGLEGVERSYDGWLTGEPGRRTVRKDRYGRVVENISLKEKQEGKPLTLSIDQRLQAIAYRAIKQAVSDFRAMSGSVVMIDIKTGEVLAMVNAPSYNPNDRSQLQNFRMRNRVSGTANLNTIVDTGNGIMRIGGSRVRDSSKVGKANLTTILKKSSNIGVAHLALNMPLQELLAEYSAVGLADPSGLSLIGEATGIFPDRRRWSDFEIATLAFGYGLSVTPIQLAHAYATLGAYGEYRPLSILKTTGPTPGKQVVNREHAKAVLAMMETVTQPGGTATKAAVPGYRVAAKTGTSRKAVRGGYSDEYMTVTAGVAPVSNPRIALVTIVNQPQGDEYYAGQVAAPIFGQVMKDALQILNVAPDESTVKHIDVLN
jgi:cell division protein FtsI (penicillin-binding protein 3)